MDKSDARRENRYRRLMVGHDEMLTFYRRILEHDAHSDTPAFFVSFDGVPQLPADAQVVAVHYEPYRLAFSVLLYSAEFEPVPPGEEVPVYDAVYRRAVQCGGKCSVSLPPVVKTWEGENAADAPSAQELPAGAVTQAEREISPGVFLKPGPNARWADAPPQMTNFGIPPEIAEAGRSGRETPVTLDGKTVGRFKIIANDALSAAEASMYPEPAKSEARLALEYDLKQLLPVAPGGILDRSIQNGPDLLLSDALRRAKAGNPGDAVRYLTRAE